MFVLIIKIVCAILVSLPNLILTYKIVIRPHIHSIFNSSLVCFFGIGAIFGPVLSACIIDIFSIRLGGNADNAIIDACSRYLELHQLLEESLKMFGFNIMFSI